MEPSPGLWTVDAVVFLIQVVFNSHRIAYAVNLFRTPIIDYIINSPALLRHNSLYSAFKTLYDARSRPGVGRCSTRTSHRGAPLWEHCTSAAPTRNVGRGSTRYDGCGACHGYWQTDDSNLGQNNFREDMIIDYWYDEQPCQSMLPYTALKKSKLCVQILCQVTLYLLVPHQLCQSRTSIIHHWHCFSH